MALPTSPPISLQQVENEFATNTVPTPATLGSMHDTVFGSGTRNLLQFLGTGQPTATVTSITNVTNSSADVNINIGYTGGLSTTYVVEYDTDSGFGSFDTAIGGSTSATGGQTITLVDLSSNTTYYVRAVVYNAYNNGASADYNRSASDSFTTASGLSDLSGLSGSIVNTDDFDMSWTDSNGTLVDDYDLQYRVNGTSDPYGDPTSLVSSTNWGTSNTSRSGVWDTPESDLSTNDWQVRVRGRNTGTGETTNWATTVVLGGGGPM